MNRKVAIQGIHGAFHEEAARRYFGEAIEIVPCMRFDDLVSSVSNGNSDYGVIAVENTIAGSLNQNLVLIDRSNVHIVGEVSLRIKQTLGALPGQSIEDIREVMSHHMALHQSSQFLSGIDGVKLVEIADTALGAKLIADGRLRGVAAVGSHQAMTHYGLDILADEIETNKLNHTRFFVIASGPSPSFDASANKCTLHITLRSETGSLYHLLEVFVQSNINLTKIESIPIEGQPYHYGFIIDCEFENASILTTALEDIDRQVEKCKVLGAYRAFVNQSTP